MNIQSTKKITFLTVLLALLAVQGVWAQTNVVRKCINPSPVGSFDNTAGALVGPAISFINGVDVPAGHVIADIQVEIVWSKTLGTCGVPTAGAVNLSEVGFGLQGPGATAYFAASSFYAGFYATGPTFSGTTQILSTRSTFRMGGQNSQPGGLPNTTTYRPNGQQLSDFYNTTPYGNWNLIAIDDAPAGTGRLCIEQVCITLFTCPNTLTAICLANPSLPLDNTGNATVRFTTVNNNSDTACLLRSATFTPASFTCANRNTTVPVTMVITDNLNNSATCTSNVSIVDTTRPIINCRAYTVFLNAAGTFSMTAFDSLLATDNCGVTSRRFIAPPSAAEVAAVNYNCLNIGLNPLTLVAYDASGNRQSCQVFVTVRDTVPPVAICKNIDAFLNGTGQVTVAAIAIDNGSADACPPITSYQINGQANQLYTCANLGANAAVLQVLDGRGNAATCNATVTVRDTVRPTAVCQNINAYLNAAGAVTVPAAAINNGSSDNCTSAAALAFLVNGAASVSYTCAQLGVPQNVTLRVTDAWTNFSTCAATITVLDTIRPTALCTNTTAFVNAAGTVTVPPSAINNTSTDNCTASGGLAFLLNGSATGATFTCASIGTPQAVILTVTDASGNSQTCTGNVSVVDTVRPIANCQTSINAYIGAAGTASVVPTQLDNVSTDNCAITNRFINGAASASYTCVQVGSTQPATLRVEDAAGNFRECITNVTVLDTTPPVARCRNRTLSLNGAGTITVFPSDIDNIVTPSSDNCGAVSLLINNQASITFTCASVGNNNVILTATDNVGLTHTCTAIITIQDNTPPVAVCQNITVYVNAAGAISVPATAIRNAAASDNCGIVTTRINGVASATYTCDSLVALVGVRTGILTLTDAAGQSSTCNAQITVRDSIRPNASCRNITVALNAAGQAVVYPRTGANSINFNSTDNCSISSYLINNLDSVVYTCANLGANTATLLVADASGTTASCASTVTILDQLAPTANCFNTVNAFLPASGTVAVTAIQVDSASADNCAITSRTINGAASITYTCADIGSNNVVLNVTDANTNSNLCVSTIQVRDTVRPTAFCNAIVQAYVSNAGTVTVTPAQINAGSSDNCGTVSLLINGAASAAYNCTQLGNNSATLRVTDASGNTATCSSIVNVVDTILPIATCRNITVTLSSVAVNGDTTIFPSAIDNGSADNCGITSRLINNQASLTFNCASIGLSIVTLRVADATGNNQVCQSNVTTIDSRRPIAVCQNITVTLSSTGVASITPLSIDGGSTDNCGITNRTISQDTFRCNNIGANNVTLRIFDASGNVDSCQAIVTVRDATAPIARCFGTVNAYLNTTGLVTVTAAQVDSLSTDNCSINSRTINGSASQSYSCGNIGANNVTLVVTDPSGNTATCPSIIQVRDTVRPLLTCSAITVTLSSTGTATVSPNQVATSSDNCTSFTMLINGAATAAYTCANRGANSVTIRSTDNAGNSVTCASTVTIRDTISPVANCRNVNLYLTTTGIAVLTAAQVNNGSTDNCAIADYFLSRDTFRCADIGAQNVIMTVRDSSNLASACNATVTVFDTTRPVVSCVPYIAYLNALGSVTVFPSNIDAGSADACGIANRTINGKPSETYGCPNVGVRNVTLAVFDNNGNVDSCQTTVTVRDTIRPVISCQNITVSLNAVGQVTVNATTIATATDNCNSVTITMGGATSRAFNCANIGANNVTMLATDLSGNTVTCPAVVTVQDVNPPTAQCRAATVYLNSAGTATVTPALIDNGSNDACGIRSMTTNPSTVTCANIGTITVTLTVVDSNNLSSTCQASLTVADTFPPTMVCRPDTAYLDANGFISVLPADINGGTTDACGLNSLLINGTSNLFYTCAQTGLQNVTLSASDVYGNTASCPSTVLVRDTIRPIAICRSSIIAYLTPAGNIVVNAVRLDSASTDNCSINTTAYLINGAASQTYTCANIATPQAVTLRVSDASGNTATCPSVVLVRDTIRPTASCRTTPFTANLSAATGIVTVNPASINNTSTDNCTISTLLINNQPTFTFNCSQVGANVATLTVIDNSGNQNSCTATVNVNDITPPNPACRNVTVFLDTVTNNGRVRFAARFLDNGSTDNCSIVSWQVAGQDSLTFNCANINNNIVTLRVTDLAGNTATCNSVVTVRDTVRPIARCPVNPLPVFLSSTGTVTVTGAMIDAGSSDNCGIVSRLINNTTSRQYLCSNIGLNNATLTVADASGNTATCPSVIDVRDMVPPSALCQNRTVVLNNAIPAIVIVTATSLNVGSNDNCGTITMRINNRLQDTFYCSNVGPNNVTFSVTDASNNVSTCQSIVTVLDNTIPIVQCNNRTIFLNANGTATIAVNANGVAPVASPTATIATGTDGCGIIQWTINGQSSVVYTCDSIGTPRIAFIAAQDPATNTANCQAAITVVDTIRPIASCRNLTVPLSAAGTATVLPSEIDNFSSDNCGIVTYLINNQASQAYSCANVGPTTATLTIRDASGNQSTCVSTLTIQDNIAPVANCRATLAIALDINGQATVLATTMNNPTTPSTDACGPLTFLLNNQTSTAYNCSNVGSNPVILTVTDANGNASQCAAIITVADNMPPTALCRDTTIYLDNSGQVQATPAMIDNGTVDNCGIASLRINGQNSVTYTCANIGTNNATLLATGAYGNTSTCASVITVRDTVRPTVVCISPTVDITNTGFAVINAALLDPANSSNDICGIATRITSIDTVRCADAGIVPVQLIITDINGNIGVCSTTVRVLLQAPVATTNAILCANDTLRLQSSPPANGNSYNFTWSGPNGFSSSAQDTVIFPVSETDEGQYILTIVPQGGGCVSADTLNILVNTVVPPIVAVDTPACVGSPVTFHISNMSAYSANLNFSFAWAQDGNSLSNNNDSFFIAAAALSQQGLYTVTITADGCTTASTAVPLLVKDLPSAPEPTVNTPCEGETLILVTNTQDNSRTYGYQWSGPNGFTATTDTARFANASQAQAGTYTVLITDNFTCTATAMVTVTVTPTPQAPSLNYNTPLCLDDLLELTDTNTYAIVPIAYNWTLPDNSSTSTTVPQLILSAANAGTYTMFVNMNNCFSAQASILVEYEGIPLAADDILTLPFRDSVRNINIAANDIATAYSISILTPPRYGTALINTDGTLNYVGGYAAFGNDTLTYIICNANCPNSCDTAQVIIQITADFECYIPDAISPNGDGINDVWNIRCLHEYPNREVIIYSRWGNLVYEGNGTDFDGRFNGQHLPDGTYFYIIKLNSTQFVPNDEIKGYLIINR
jgi:gliding motility-associated-like protein